MMYKKKKRILRTLKLKRKRRTRPSIGRKSRKIRRKKSRMRKNRGVKYSRKRYAQEGGMQPIPMIIWPGAPGYTPPVRPPAVNAGGKRVGAPRGGPAGLIR